MVRLKWPTWRIQQYENLNSIVFVLSALKFIAKPDDTWFIVVIKIVKFPQCVTLFITYLRILIVK